MAEHAVLMVLIHTLAIVHSVLLVEIVKHVSTIDSKCKQLVIYDQFIQVTHAFQTHVKMEAVVDQMLLLARMFANVL